MEFGSQSGRRMIRPIAFTCSKSSLRPRLSDAISDNAWESSDNPLVLLLLLLLLLLLAVLLSLALGGTPSEKPSPSLNPHLHLHLLTSIALPLPECIEGFQNI